ncbi:hypothetical protein [Sneathiella sp.]|uniref:hypothetical protein n=1 Tax=Sneathiella sp. TaxID=1964365 RepID=UPI00356662E9
MNDNSGQIDSSISTLKQDIAAYQEQTCSGVMIDIGALPDRIVELQNHVQNSPREQRMRYTHLMAQLLAALDDLSHEIQLRHDVLAKDMMPLERAGGKE